MSKSPDENLKKEIMDLVKTLKKAGKYGLSGCIEKNWDKTVLAYSKELNTWKPARPMEKELLAAFKKELERLETKKIKNKTLTSKILNNIEKRRILQTAPHLGATESPRMLCLNWLSSLEVSEKDFYVVAMFSGVPFSNRSRPGRINRKKDSVNLFGSNWQDGLVYQSVIPEKLVESVPKLEEKVRKFLPETILGASYTKWALLACQNIEGEILKHKNLIYLDINEVVAEYLVRVLKKKEHIFHKIFFNQKTRAEFVKAFPNEIIFYAPQMKGKYEVMENMFFSRNALRGKNKKIPLDNPEKLIGELRNGRLCPALLVGFLALAFINEFKCLGSFAQVEYLPVYQKKLAALKCLKNFKIEKVPTANLTTGVFPFNPELFPVDAILGEKFTPDKNIFFGELLRPMKKTLLENYFTGAEKNNGQK